MFAGVQKTAEATRGSMGNKIVDKINSLGKTKSKEKEDERQEIYIPPQKRQQIIDDLRLLWHHTKTEYEKTTNLLNTTLDEVPRFITRKWIEVYDHSGSAEERYKSSKQIRFKTSMLISDLCDFSDAFIAVKRKINVTRPNNNEYDRKLAFKNNAPFVSKINNVLIDNAEDLDIVMSLYNLIWIQQKLFKNNRNFVELL